MSGKGEEAAVLGARRNKGGAERRMEEDGGREVAGRKGGVDGNGLTVSFGTHEWKAGGMNTSRGSSSSGMSISAAKTAAASGSNDETVKTPGKLEGGREGEGEGVTPPGFSVNLFFLPLPLFPSPSPSIPPPPSLCPAPLYQQPLYLPLPPSLHTHMPTSASSSAPTVF